MHVLKYVAADISGQKAALESVLKSKSHPLLMVGLCSIISLKITVQ
jgi:hypothetical protein